MSVEFEVQHPIPQEITSYQFRLVGDMTLKQFFQVAAGALIALLLYSTNLLTFIKLPLMLISFLFGIALAFFPFEDRPLEKWLILFVKSIYSPTIFTWIKTKPLSFFASDAEMMETLAQNQTPAQIQQQMSQKVPSEPTESAMAPVGIQVEATKALSGLETTEKQFLVKISEHFGNTNQPVMPTNTDTIKVPLATPTPVSSNAINQKATQPLIDHAVNITVSDNDVAKATTTVTGSLASQANSFVKQAVFSSESAPPIPPTQPNILVGQVMDGAGKIISGAILEIRDEDNRPVRALKSNTLGHFGIVTPLPSGTYEIITEKEGLMFDPVKLNVTGSLIDPIAITATNSNLTN
ncbi:PrgI family protein [Candidatus Woesebacteria bacterium]|nr:MAG: PrgI family protein [Candidatus Woesebacteria bacterium]